MYDRSVSKYYNGGLTGLFSSACMKEAYKNNTYLHVLGKAQCDCATGIIEHGCSRENDNALGFTSCVIIYRDCNHIQ